MKSTDHFFSHEEQNRIEAAVKEAETKISGEIVPVFVKQSDTYPEARLKAFISGFILSACIILLVDEWMGWGEFFLLRDAIYFLGASLLGGFIGVMLVQFFPFIKYFFVSTSRMNYCVDALARQTFLEYEVFNTRQRTGILLFVSLFEHEVEILGDTGINQKINQDEWAEIADAMIQQLKKGNRCEAFLAGIEKSRDLLLKYGFEKTPDDTNEIPDHLRQNRL
ncbi:MAG: TPM domain-containing protein [Flavobacteriales bacterium]|nr:TPM domain-containing protein [Flavobacteriales bacterium]